MGVGCKHGGLGVKNRSLNASSAVHNPGGGGGGGVLYGCDPFLSLSVLAPAKVSSDRVCLLPPPRME